MIMMNRISSDMPQLIWFLSAPVGYFVSARIFLNSASFQPFNSLSLPTLMSTLSGEVAGSVVDVNDNPDLVMKSFALSQSLNLDHGPTKMWKLQSFAATVIGLAAE